jgi:alpha-tubulin suppressor-like RCC1 family protein
MKTKGGKVWVWGQGSDYQLGTTERTMINRPMLLSSESSELAAKQWVEVATGWGHTIALLAD